MMGGCIGINRTKDTETVNGSSTNISRPASGPSVGGAPRKNHSLCHETIRWKSDVPLTECQLLNQRDEFWDTAHLLGGRKEIWDALRAATVAVESLDFHLTQAILDGASVSVPNGYLTECYDELGSQYKVPIYCLSYPINIVKEDNVRDSPTEYSEPVDDGSELRLSSSSSDTIAPSPEIASIIKTMDLLILEARLHVMRALKLSRKGNTYAAEAEFKKGHHKDPTVITASVEQKWKEVSTINMEKLKKRQLEVSMLPKLPKPDDGIEADVMACSPYCSGPAEQSAARHSYPASGPSVGGAPRKNHSLCHETIRWKSDVPLTEGQLLNQRDEFWDTAHLLGGRKEIWDALRAATVAVESLDFHLTQAILDKASVSVPNGYLTECYDELGSQYKVPIYCLSYPINIVKEDNVRDSPTEYSEPVDDGSELRLSSSSSDTIAPSPEIASIIKKMDLLIHKGICDGVSILEARLHVMRALKLSREGNTYAAEAEFKKGHHKDPTVITARVEQKWKEVSTINMEKLEERQLEVSMLPKLPKPDDGIEADVMACSPYCSGPAEQSAARHSYPTSGSGKYVVTKK